MRQEIDWQALRLAATVEDRQAITRLSRGIKNAKQTLERLREWRPLLMELASRSECEKHWLKHCYTCHLAQHDLLISKVNKNLAVMRWRLFEFVYTYGFASRPATQPKVTAMARPLDTTDYGSRWDNKFWDSTAANFRSEPLRARDVQDNLALIQSYLNGKFTASK